MLHCSLRPHRHYQFRIAASNDVGTSNFSVPTRAVMTLDAAPDSPPVSVTARTVSPTSVLVSWTVSLLHMHITVNTVSYSYRLKALMVACQLLLVNINSVVFSVLCCSAGFCLSSASLFSSYVPSPIRLPNVCIRFFMPYASDQLPKPFMFCGRQAVCLGVHDEVCWHSILLVGISSNLHLRCIWGQR